MLELTASSIAAGLAAMFGISAIVPLDEFDRPRGIAALICGLFVGTACFLHGLIP